MQQRKVTRSADGCAREMLKVNQCSLLQLFLDGHGGAVVAKHASMYLHKFIVRRPEFPEDIPEALRQVREIIIKALFCVIVISSGGDKKF